MAESQVPYAYDDVTVQAISRSLSRERFAPYLDRAGGDAPHALDLYLYNARLAKAFLFPLGVAEITLRNNVDRLLVHAHGDEWHLPGFFHDDVLTLESREALAKAMRRANSQNRGKVIAELTFDFWSNLFRSDYASFWRTRINIAFPGLAHGEGRAEIQGLVRPINHLRNRVAHHEPILDINVPDEYGRLIRLVQLCCGVTATWMQHHATIHVVMRSRPAPGRSPRTLVDRADPRYRKVAGDMPVAELLRGSVADQIAFVCCDEAGQAIDAFTHSALTAFLAIKVQEEGAVMDLDDFTVADILNKQKSSARLVPADTPLQAAIELLGKPRVGLLVAIDPASRTPMGVLLRAHRRY